MHAGFEWAVRHLTEFPTPAHVRDCARIAAVENRKKLTDEAQKNQRMLEDKAKDDRFDSTDLETRKREFTELMRKVFEGK